MPTPNSDTPHASHVTALYRDGWQQFALPVDATLAELADRLEAFAMAHDGAPVMVEVQFDPPPLPVAAIRPLQS